MGACLLLFPDANVSLAFYLSHSHCLAVRSHCRRRRWCCCYAGDARCLRRRGSTRPSLSLSFSWEPESNTETTRERHVAPFGDLVSLLPHLLASRERGTAREQLHQENITCRSCFFFHHTRSDRQTLPLTHTHTRTHKHALQQTQVIKGNENKSTLRSAKRFLVCACAS